MNYPTINEYKEAILFAEDNFEQLKNLRPVLEDDGSPVMTSGNFAVVFKMKDEKTGNLYAVKCFLREQEGRAEAYRMIAEELEYVSSTFLTPIKYLDKELFVDTNAGDEKEFPVLLMDWVEGETLDKYIRKHLDDQYELSLIAYQFSRLAMWLMPQPFAHGDLKPDNILVKSDGTLVLVDYDGMYVPAMKGQKARELGSPDFRHPSRTDTDFDEHIDDFSLASILLSLKAIAYDPALLKCYGVPDCFPFSEKDYRDITQCDLLMDLFPSEDSELNILLSLFIIALEKGDLSQVSFRLFNLSRPERPNRQEEYLSKEIFEEFHLADDDKILSTRITNDDLDEYERILGVTDEFGGTYSIDGLRLLEVDNDNISSYQIRQGTIVICDSAFSRCKSLKSVIIPSSVSLIGVNPFANAGIIDVQCKSDAFLVDNYALFKKDKSKLISYFGNDIQYTVPQETNEICDAAFEGCTSLESIVFPDNLNTIGYYSFARCTSLKTINLPFQLSEIADFVFEECYSLQSIHISDNVRTIGEGALCKCESLQSLTIPISIAKIGSCAFADCRSLKSIYFLRDSIDIQQDILCGCDMISSIFVPKGSKDFYKRIFIELNNKIVERTVIGNPYTIVSNADLENVWVDEFGAQYSLDRKCLLKVRPRLGVTKYVVLEGAKVIGNHAFANNPLWEVTIPNSVTHIGSQIFWGCTLLTKVTLPSSISYIDSQALYGCEQLCIIYIPIGTRNKYERLLPDYKDKLVEQDGGWIVEDSRLFDQEEIAAVKKAEVVASQNGKSVCFFMCSGGQIYIPLCSQSNLKVGDKLDMKTAKVLTLSREGEDDIARIIE